MVENSPKPVVCRTSKHYTRQS